MCVGRFKEFKDTTLVSGCKYLVLTSPHIDLSETATCTMWVVSEWASNVGFYWLVHLTLNLGQDSLSQHVSHFKIFGSSFDCHVCNESRKNLEQPIELGIFLGYTDTPHNYRVDLTSLRISYVHYM